MQRLSCIVCILHCAVSASSPRRCWFTSLTHPNLVCCIRVRGLREPETSQALVQVAQVVSVEGIASVKLYKCIVELSNGVTKQVMAGLKQHMARDDLLHTLVVVITNLKAAKLAGESSEAMILAAQAPMPDSPSGELVKVLRPSGERQVPPHLLSFLSQPGGLQLLHCMQPSEPPAGTGHPSCLLSVTDYLDF